MSWLRKKLQNWEDQSEYEIDQKSIFQIYKHMIQNAKQKISDNHQRIKSNLKDFQFIQKAKQKIIQRRQSFEAYLDNFQQPEKEKFNLGDRTKSQDRMEDLIDEQPEKFSSKFIQKIMQRKDILKQKLKNKQNKLKYKLSGSAFKKFQDKIGMVAGIFNLMIICYFFGQDFGNLLHYLVFLLLTVIFIRIFKYFALKLQFFMIDFCFYSIFLTVWFIWFQPKNEQLFYTIFSFNNGPLLWTIVQMRNSFVFHSLERQKNNPRITSVYIHFIPALITYCIRWSNEEQYRYLIPQITFYHFLQNLIYSMVVYLIWVRS